MLVFFLIKLLNFFFQNFGWVVLFYHNIDCFFSVIVATVLLYYFFITILTFFFIKITTGMCLLIKTSIVLTFVFNHNWLSYNISQYQISKYRRFLFLFHNSNWFVVLFFFFNQNIDSFLSKFWLICVFFLSKHRLFFLWF